MVRRLLPMMAALMATAPALACQVPPLPPGVLATHASSQVPPTFQVPAPIDAKYQKELDDESALGKKYAAEVEKENKLSTNKEFIERVERVGGEIAAIARTQQVDVSWGDKRLSPFNYTFKVIEGDDVNAFSLPGGYIYVYEGFMRYVESDDELAGVMAHEVAHASFRHLATLNREAQKFQAVSLPLLLVAILSGGQAGGDLLALNQLVGIAVGGGWSVKAEKSADWGGFQYILQSKYSPVGLLTFMERLARDERSQPKRQLDWGIYRTHPPSRERAEALIENLNGRGIQIRRSAVTQTFRTHVRPADNGGVEVLFSGRALFKFSGDSALQRADDAAARLDAFFDNVPELFELRVLGDGMVEGRRKFLFRITAEDAALAGITTYALADETEANLKRALYMLSYRIWDGR